MATGITIGEAARRSGCPVATIRYYEEVGLLRPAARSAAGRRVFGMPDIERLRLIRRLRTMDIGLDAVRELVDAMGRGGAACLDVRDMALAHLEAVRARRAELDALDRTLTRLTATCSAACKDGPDASCTIIADLIAA
ncbi:MAG: MerR family transcriptional regulator [Alphaproteobacteria bacterium]|nr:MAG: MerR family transcriptional regulator [Caulobacteraceae bacterium]TPW02144.1 MAG: MerR family transcriptional regulator [Alphaproteobacteria bacterium]